MHLSPPPPVALAAVHSKAVVLLLTIYYLLLLPLFVLLCVCLVPFCYSALYVILVLQSQIDGKERERWLLDLKFV